jgi:WD repeat-containing protein 40A
MDDDAWADGEGWDVSSSHNSEEGEMEEGDGAAWQAVQARRRADVRARSEPSELLAREMGRTSGARCRAAWHDNAPLGLREVSLPAHGFNKVFAQAWLDHERFLTGSKDNRLALWSVSSRDSAPATVSLLPLPVPQRPAPPVHGGIHSLALDAPRRLLATGSGSPSEVAVLETEKGFAARAVCVGHADWVFGVEWIDEGVLWTASRDRTLKVRGCDIKDCCLTFIPKVWRIPDEAAEAGAAPIAVQAGATLKHHSDRVRALRHDAAQGVAASLGSDRRLALWDPPTGQLLRSCATRDHEDLIALDADARHGLFAVGGRDFVSFFDRRVDGILCSAQTCNRGMGVRSLCFRDNLLSVGGGLGRLSFFDLAAGKFRRFDEERSYRLVTRPPGEGAEGEPQAIYVHRWDDAGARLFVGGGPLLLQSNGGHASLW